MPKTKVHMLQRVTWALLSLNFFMADMGAGSGPFLGIFLQAKGWKSGMIGTVMMLGGIAGLIVTIPMGALIDATKRKRAYIVIASVFIIAASAVVLLSQDFWVVAASQVATAVAGSVVGPAALAMTLGLARQRGFNRMNGRNQVYNHAGNLTGAALAGYLGWRFDFAGVFALAFAFGIGTVVSVLLIPAKQIDDQAARGLEGDTAGGKVSGMTVLLKSRPLLILAAALGAFHLGNGSMLPLFGLAVVAKNADGSTGMHFVALIIVVAQATMVLMSYFGTRFTERHGYWLVLLVSFAALPLRGYIAAHAIATWGIYPVQVLDGIGAGLQSVAVPGLVARILSGTGRVNAGQGAVAAACIIGASISPGIGGWLAEAFGYPVAFIALGSCAILSIGLWVVFARQMREACQIRGTGSPFASVEPAGRQGALVYSLSEQ